MAFSFSTPQQQQQSSSFFQAPPPQQQQQQMQQFQAQQQPQMFLFTHDKAPATFGTKWPDLHPDSQKILLQIEERILEHRDESHRLDQCSRLYDSSVSNYGFDQDASHIVQELGGIGTSMERQKALLQDLMASMKDMLHNTEVAVRSFMMLQPRFAHPSTGASSATAPLQPSGAGSASQPTATSAVPVFDFYSGIPKKPSLFLQQTVARFEKYLGQCRQWIEELEQLLVLDSGNKSSNGSSLLQSLPKVMGNVHEFFVHVASKVESIHQYIESMRAAYLVNQRRQGDANDPFVQADRREIARREAAAKRAHPTSHLPANSQPPSQASVPVASSASQPAAIAPPVSATPASTGSGFSLFNTPVAPSTSVQPSLFTTPSASTSGLSLFPSPLATPQSTSFASSASLFSSATPGFASTTPAGGSLFSTSFASGAGIGSGASFNNTSKSSKPKSRTGRR